MTRLHRALLPTPRPQAAFAPLQAPFFADPPASIRLLCALVLLLSGATPPARGAPPDESARFRRQAERFLEGTEDERPPIAVAALATFLEAEHLYRSGRFDAAMRRIDELFAAHPPGAEEWVRANRTFSGLNIGHPPCYAALRMLRDAAAFRVRDQGRSAGERHDVLPWRLAIVLVGRAHGIEPRTWKELEQGAGVPVRRSLHPLLLEDDHAVVRTSLWLFGEYLAAATDGRLRLEPVFVPLPHLDVEVAVRQDDLRYAGLADGQLDRIFAAVPRRIRRSVDAYWVLYPSHVPERHRDFESTEFITGGMALSPAGGPCFLIDDLWLVRKPPHLGRGPYSDIERRAYLPQWLQHEFFHHLFLLYPRLGLEARGHQWFDRSTWPEDFEGALEPDYYHEALWKRLVNQQEPPLWLALKHDAPPPERFARLRAEDLLGEYVHEPVENDWHRVTLRRVGRELEWVNAAGVSWRLRPDLSDGTLRSGPDNPYFDPKAPRRADVEIVLERDAEGDWLPRVAGLRFLGGFYRRLPPQTDRPSAGAPGGGRR